MRNDKVCFVILHYLDIRTTQGCVDSILNNIKYENYNIVVVDNGSPNESGYQLKELYKQEKKVTVLINNQNLGFARGNNVGYHYAKVNLHADFIIITNNDTVFEQQDFVNNMIRAYELEGFHVAAPDIYTPSGQHQNPHRTQMLSIQKVKKMLFVKQIFLAYFLLKQRLGLDNKIQILEKWYDAKNKKNIGNKNYRDKQVGIVPMGASIIYSPLYIQNEEWGFCDATFMYGEEDLLAYMCAKKSYKTIYLPEIVVYHLNGEVTQKKYGDSLAKNIFTYKYIVKGLEILLKEMKNDL